MSKNLKPGNVLLIAVLFAAVVVFALVFAFYNFNLGKKQATGEPSVVKDEQVQKLETLSDSDEIGAIEGDIQGTSLDNLDQELNQVDQNLSELVSP